MCEGKTGHMEGGGKKCGCMCVCVWERDGGRGKGEEACVWEGRGGSGPHTSGTALHMHACMLVGLD